MKRRLFIAGLGSAAAWPVVARAQQNRVRRLGVLVSTLAADDPEWQDRGTAFMQRLQELGWTGGRNVRIDYRWGLGDPERLRKFAAELLALTPDVILAAGAPAVGALQRGTRTVPIVFANVTDPVGSGHVASLAQPGGNITGFMNTEYGQSGKWLELLKSVAPQVTRAGVFRNPEVPNGVGQFGAIQAVAPLFRVLVSPLDQRDSDEIERAVTAFAREPDGGLIVTQGAPTVSIRESIIALAARHRLPAVYPFRAYVAGGGLVSYGIDQIEPYRLAAGYVDRILRREKPADLPVQAPTKYETVFNLMTAKALGLTIPESLLATADQVIE
jgi:putative tryptophan/tyrosine transport system substrate-binding protein